MTIIGIIGLSKAWLQSYREEPSAKIRLGAISATLELGFFHPRKGFFDCRASFYLQTGFRESLVLFDPAQCTIPAEVIFPPLDGFFPLQVFSTPQGFFLPPAINSRFCDRKKVQKPRSDGPPRAMSETNSSLHVPAQATFRTGQNPKGYKTRLYIGKSSNSLNDRVTQNAIQRSYCFPSYKLGRCARTNVSNCCTGL